MSASCGLQIEMKVTTSGGDFPPEHGLERKHSASTAGQI